MTSRKTLKARRRDPGGLDGARVDRGQLEEDRRDHEQHVQLHERQVDREVRVEQEVERSEAELAREVVDRAVLAEHGRPGDDADQVRGPERREHEDEERYLRAQALDLREEVRDGIADHEREQAHEHGALERARERGTEDLGVPERAVVLHRPAPGLEAVGVARPERDGRS
jgi:hypothetical protein